MKLNKSQNLIIIGVLSLGVLFSIIFVILRAVGKGYKQNLNNQEFEKLNQQLNQEDYDIRRIKLETEDGRVIEILQNGTLIRNDGDTDQAIIGYGKLTQLFSSLTEDEIKKLYQNQDTSSNSGNTITFETKSGNTYIIEIPDEDIPEDLEEIIEDIKDTTQDTLDPTPYPSYSPTPTPTPIPTTSPTTSPNPTPTPTINPTTSPSPTPSASSVPEYITNPLFDCSDYDLIKNTVISNIICAPNP